MSGMQNLDFFLGRTSLPVREILECVGGDLGRYGSLPRALVFLPSTFASFSTVLIYDGCLIFPSVARCRYVTVKPR